MAGINSLFDRTDRPSNRFNQIGAGLFIIWGVIHIWVGGSALLDFFTSGPAEMFTQSEIYLEPSEIDATLTHVGNVMAHYYFDIAGLGILAIIVAATLVWENDPLGMWINSIILGITDFAFVYLQIVPGYQPFFPQILAPIIYVLAVIFAVVGLLHSERLAS
jgi:hypothetical protein